MPKNLKRLVDDATENYGPGSGWEEEFGEIIVGARKELARYDEAIRLLRLREPGCSGDGEFISSVDLNKLTAAFLAAEGRK
ncbi:MAG: hypothetical protein IT382_22800 [Deltaproteobacteria bacterium]|nr:hypothetical protein [Deltaproteobacteria bacterium]